MPGGKESKLSNPLEGAEALFGAKEGEFSEKKDAIDETSLLKFENDEDVEENIQRALSRSVADRYEKMKREGFTIERTKQYGAEFLKRVAALRQKQEEGKIAVHEAKELYGAEAELNNAMDQFEDEKKASEKSIPGIAKSIAEVYAQLVTDETGGEVRMKQRERFGRDIEQYIGSIRVENYRKFQQCVEMIHRHAAIAQEVAAKEQQLLDEGRLILGVQARSLSELRQKYLATSNEMLAERGGDDVWWERLQKIIAATKALNDPIREHEEFQKLRKEIVVKYIQSEAGVQEGIMGVMGGYMRDYARGKAGKITLEKQRENLQLLIRKKLITRERGQAIYNELEAKANAESARMITGHKELPAPPKNLKIPRIAGHVREIVAAAVKKPTANKTLGGFVRKALGWLKWGEWR